MPVYLCTCALVQRLSKKERDGDFVPEGGGPALQVGEVGGRTACPDMHVLSTRGTEDTLHELSLQSNRQLLDGLSM